MIHGRVSIWETWMTVAETVAMRSRCERSRVGAVIVAADGRIVSTGYNGPPARWSPASPTAKCSSWCPRGDTHHDQNFDECPSVHAELNALLYCDREQALDSTMYVTKSPCISCCKAIAAAGVTSVRWPLILGDTRAEAALKFLKDCGITVMETPPNG